MSARAIAAVLSLLLAACAPPGPPENDSLYRALGERPGIAAIVDETLDNVSQNSRIVAIFADSDIGRLEAKLVEQICELSGGPCTYTGDPMDEVHADLGIGPAEFNAFVEDLRDAMQTLDVPESARNRLLARLAPMRDDILQESSAAE